MNTLQGIGFKHGTDKATYHQFCDFYEKHLPPRRESVKLLEIGVKDGASLKMWADYYPNGDIFGIDINEPLRFRRDNIRCLQGNAASDHCIEELIASYPRFDIIIDDGSHMTFDQQFTFSAFRPFMRSGDIYIIEDIHTSTWPQYRNTPRTTEEFVRELTVGWQIFTYHNEHNAADDSITMLIIKP